MKKKIFKYVCSAVLLLSFLFLCQIQAEAADEMISISDKNGITPYDNQYDGPQIVKIRVLKEGNYLEIYWDRYVDEKQAVNNANFVLKNGNQTIYLYSDTTQDWGWTNTLYFDKGNKTVAAAEANVMERLDRDLHMSSLYFSDEDSSKLGNMDENGLTLEVKGSAITDENGKKAKDAVYTGIPRVAYYTQQVVSDTGIIVKADDTVAYTSLELAADQIDVFLKKAGTGIAKTMKDANCSLAVYSPHQNVYLIPEHRGGFSLDMYDVEGYGGNRWNNCVSSIAERNILRTRNAVQDPALNTGYRDENILIHEFGHCVKSVGLEENPDSSYIEEYRRAYENAKTSGLWPNTYAISNEDEFFATMCTIWYDVMSEARDWNDGTRSPVNTRAELKAYDPVTYAFFEKILTDEVLPAPWDEAAPDNYHYSRPAEKKELIASYDMTVEESRLIDKTENRNHASYVGFTDADFQSEGEDVVLMFDGTEKYIQLPAGLIQSENFAIEATFKTNTSSTASWLWCLGAKDNTNYIFVSPDFYGSVIRSGIMSNGTEQLLGNGNAGSIAMGEYTKIRMEYDDGVMRLFVNDNLTATLNTEFSVQDILEAGTVGDVCGYIGKSLYTADEPFTGTLTQFDVYAETIEKPVVDKDGLKAAIDKKVDVKDTYTDASWKVYADALAKANEVNADAAATQEEVDAAAKALTNAINKLEKKPLVVTVDKKTLQKIIQNAIPTDKKDEYTADSWKVYADALAKANEVNEDAAATQEEVDAAAKALTDAQEALKEKTEDPKPVEKELPYVDVAKGDWFYDGVYYNYFAKTMTGKDDTHFAPLENLARAQFAVIIHRINGKPAVEYKPTFPDVADHVWYTDAILWAASTGVVKGYTDTGLFGVSDNINREQMAVMMYRYANYLNYDTSRKADFDTFEDAASVSEFANEAMKWAVGNGIITGKYNGTKIDPQGNALRAECAIIIQRFMEKSSEMDVQNL